MIHPARKLPFSDVHSALQEAREAGLVNEQRGDDGLRLYCYTRSAVFDRQWNDATLMARGLVLDVDRQQVVATPFPKFFNVGEGQNTIPALAFETFEKVDGSLIIIFWHQGAWRTATKGSLRSKQAQWAARQLALTGDPSGVLRKGTTYLAEAIYPENRIVIRYEEQGLVLLGAYDEDGHEHSYQELQAVGDMMGWRVARRYAYSSVADLIARSADLPASEEGFVLRFTDGLRLKVKGEEYRRIHALISRCAPLTMWEAMQAGDDLNLIRRDLPEEFWGDFDAITTALSVNLNSLIERVRNEAETVAALSDKEVGLRLNQFPSDLRPFIFPYRKNAGVLCVGRTRQSVFRAIRPTANHLPGYVPSYAINRVMEEDA